MNEPTKFILVIVLVCIISVFGGYTYGMKQQQERMDQYFELLNYGAWATDVKANVKVLDLLEARKYKDAENLLENFLDVRLASISLYDKLAVDHPDEDIFLAINAAKEHRKDHPSHQVPPSLEQGVARAFKITERK